MRDIEDREAPAYLVISRVTIMTKLGVKKQFNADDYMQGLQGVI